MQYTYFNFVYKSVSWVAVPTAFAILLCGGAVCVSLSQEVRDIIAAYLLVARALRERRLGCDAASARVLAALFLHELRVVLLSEFVVATCVLMGTGDGAFNVLLNSLAVG